jgi:hypothetical protein
VSRDPRISGIRASKSGMEESFDFATCEVPKRSGSSIYGGRVAVIGELPGVRRTRDQCRWGQSPETPRVSGPSNRRTRGDDRGIVKTPERIISGFGIQGIPQMRVEQGSLQREL